jgi:hypothetical protein
MSLPRDIIFKILQDLDPISYYNCISISNHFYIYNSDAAKKLYLKNRCIGRTIDNMIYNLDIDGIEYMVHKFHMKQPLIQLNIDDINRDKIEKCADILSKVQCYDCEREQFCISYSKNNNILYIRSHNCGRIYHNKFILKYISIDYFILHFILYKTCKNDPRRLSIYLNQMFPNRISFKEICENIRIYICEYCVFLYKHIFLIDKRLAKLLSNEIGTKMTYRMVENYLYHILDTRKYLRYYFYKK